MRSVIFCLLFLGCHRPMGVVDASHVSLAHGKKVKRSDSFAAALVALVESSDPANASLEPYCSGVLIGPKTVITAAHCLSEDKVGVAFGLGLLPAPQIVTGSIVKHPHYGQEYNEAFSFDLGLVLLSEKAPEFAIPLSIISDDRYQVGDRMIVAGYGSVAQDVSDERPFDNRGQPYWTAMRITDIFRQGDEDARDDLFYWGLISAEATDESSGGCDGDSGGPLIAIQGTTPLLAGIVNGTLSGRRCDRQALFTNLSFYRQWIVEQSDKAHFTNRL